MCASFGYYFLKKGIGYYYYRTIFLIQFLDDPSFIVNLLFNNKQKEFIRT